MRFSPLLLPVIGLALLAAVLRQADLGVLITQIATVGWATFALLFALFGLYFAADVVNWQAALLVAPRTPRWFARLWLVRMIGDAYNNLTPIAAVGGEPVKAWLLESRYGIAYRDTGAGIVIARTCTMFALIGFALIGVVLVWRRPGLGTTAQVLALVSLVVVIAGTGAIFLVQFFHLSTRWARWLGATRRGAQAARSLAAIEDIDRGFKEFYAAHRGPLTLSIAAAFVAWVLGAVEAWIVLHALGVPASFADVWIMEAFVLCVRTAAFFIPGALGAQEAATYVMVEWLLGATSAGVATAVIRRARELVWIALGLMLGIACAVGPRRVAQLRL